MNVIQIKEQKWLKTLFVRALSRFLAIFGYFDNSTVHSAIDFRIAIWVVNIFHKVSQLKRIFAEYCKILWYSNWLTNVQNESHHFHKRAFKEDIYERYLTLRLVALIKSSECVSNFYKLVRVLFELPCRV